MTIRVISGISLVLYWLIFSVVVLLRGAKHWTVIRGGVFVVLLIMLLLQLVYFAWAVGQFRFARRAGKES